MLSFFQILSTFSCMLLSLLLKVSAANGLPVGRERKLMKMRMNGRKGSNTGPSKPKVSRDADETFFVGEPGFTYDPSGDKFNMYSDLAGTDYIEYGIFNCFQVSEELFHCPNTLAFEDKEGYGPSFMSITEILDPTANPAARGPLVGGGGKYAGRTGYFEVFVTEVGNFQVYLFFD